MSSLAHARVGIPWWLVGLVSLPTSLLVVVALLMNDSAWAGGVMRGGLMMLAVPASFLLDEPSAPAAAASPRSPRWCHASRLLGLVPLLFVAGVLSAVWAQLVVVEQLGVLLLTVTACVLLSTSAAAALRGLGHGEPGELVAGGVVLILLPLLLFAPSLRGVELLPQPGSASAGEVGMWVGLTMASAGLLVVTPSWH